MSVAHGFHEKGGSTSDWQASLSAYRFSNGM